MTRTGFESTPLKCELRALHPDHPARPQHEGVGSTADVSEVPAAFIFRVEVGAVGECYTLTPTLLRSLKWRHYATPKRR
jgi:hypothetical protein